MYFGNMKTLNVFPKTLARSWNSLQVNCLFLRASVRSVRLTSWPMVKWVSSIKTSNEENLLPIQKSDKSNNDHEEVTFIPKSTPVSKNALKEVQDFVNVYKRLFVLTGAGISTESGIPDYRSEGVGLYARSNSRPILYHDFLRSASRRKRYWARNFVGWPRFRSFQPNVNHRTLAQWERAGKIHWMVTQNVDSLHTKAQSQRVIELHGCSARIICLSCGQKTTRDELQIRMMENNPHFNIEAQVMAPDGDVILSDELVQGFIVPTCKDCGGILKPDLVFFGDNVPRVIRESAYDRLQESDALLVAGSSLEVYSGYRIALAARDQKKTIGIINIGPTRADKLATMKIDARLSSVLPYVT